MPYKPTQAMRDAARVALEYNDSVSPSNRWGTPVGRRRARKIMDNGEFDKAEISQIFAFLSRFKKDKIFNIKEELYIILKLWFNLNMNSFIFRLSRLISLIVLIIILGTNYYYFFIEAKMYGLSRDGIVGLLFICSILIIITIIFNWLCFGKFSIWIKKDKFSDE